MNDKVKLFRLIHNINWLYISVDGSLNENQPLYFTGVYYDWYKSGQLHREINFKNDELHGKFIRWYENGMKEFEWEWKDGKEYGKFVKWRANGSISHETFND